MKDWIKRVGRSGIQTLSGQADRALEQTCAGRVVSALTFLIVIFCLSLWITIFIWLKDQLFSETLSGNVLTNLTCIIFFGGLVLAIFIGTLAGNFLRRTFWKMLVKRHKKDADGKKEKGS